VSSVCKTSDPSSAMLNNSRESHRMRTVAERMIPQRCYVERCGSQRRMQNFGHGGLTVCRYLWNWEPTS